MTSLAAPQRVRLDGRVTAAVFSHNEAPLLEDCLPRLQDFDELMVCDMESTDETAAVAASYRARLIKVPFASVVEAVRQIAVDAARTEWVLFVDADERVPPGFRRFLRLEDLPVDVAGVRLRYDNAVFGRQVQHVLRGSAKYSLLRCDLARYEDLRAHVPPRFVGPVIDAPPAIPAILHLNFRTLEQSFEKTIRYAGSDPRGADVFANPFRLPREIARDVLAGAWRDGRAGVVVATVNAIGRFYAATLEWEQQGYPDPGFRPAERRLLIGADALRRARFAMARWIKRRRDRSNEV